MICFHKTWCLQALSLDLAISLGAYILVHLAGNQFRVEHPTPSDWMCADPVVACVSFHWQRTSSLSTCGIDHLGGTTVTCKGNRPAAYRFEEQLLSCLQPDATPRKQDAVCTRLFVSTAAVNCRKRPRLTGGGGLSECLRHTTEDEARLPARQASSQGLGHKRQGLEDW